MTQAFNCLSLCRPPGGTCWGTWGLGHAGDDIAVQELHPDRDLCRCGAALHDGAVLRQVHQASHSGAQGQVDSAPPSGVRTYLTTATEKDLLTISPLMLLKVRRIVFTFLLQAFSPSLTAGGIYMGMTLPTILAVRDFHTFLSDISGGVFCLFFNSFSFCCWFKGQG